ncbi:acylphosphatase [Amorphus orientalis]|uniref:acylphosphatase n=1 Tax=Amorphus orientalis TaxID=649198 RepID=A0AAE3VMG2_9HYPH|nr:acylphosphatase [Amorphus orientalis]MDQ0314747.1 acylphosphatase [Amorphus orientalis]
MSDRSVHVVISGVVQGVGYRAWLSQLADAYELGGWVRNRLTGEVEAVLSGPSEVVAEVLRECHKGPRGARVSSVHVQESRHPVTSPFEVLDTN